MSTRAPWSTPGPPSVHAPRSARTCTCSAACGIGGVLEPHAGRPHHHRGQLLHRRPLRGGGRCDRRRNSVISMGVYVGQSTPKSTTAPDQATAELRPRAGRFGGGVAAACPEDRRQMQPVLPRSSSNASTPRPLRQNQPEPGLLRIQPTPATPDHDRRSRPCPGSASPTTIGDPCPRHPRPRSGDPFPRSSPTTIRGSIHPRHPRTTNGDPPPPSSPT